VCLEFWGLDTTLTNTEAMADNEQQLSFNGNIVSGGVTTNQTTTPLVLSTPAIQIRDDTYQQISTQLSKVVGQDGVGNSTTANQFGKTNTDEQDNCIQISNTPIKNRRVGTCSAAANPNQTPITNQTIPSSLNNGGDGLYTIRQRAIDTSGNRGDWTQKVVERDTVSPGAPTLNLTKQGDKQAGEQISLDERANLQITAEQYTTATLEVFKNNSKIDTRPITMSGSNYDTNTGIYSESDLLGKLECGGTTYQIKVSLVDRAGNQSTQSVSQTITTDQCGDCGGNSAKYPIHGTNVYIQHPYGYSNDYFAGSVFHTGNDFGGSDAQDGADIYPAMSGTVVDVRYTQTDDYPKTFNGGLNCTNCIYGTNANFVKIDHGNGVVSLYLHIKPEGTNLVNIGDTVTTNTKIGRVGTTGLSDGAHLHMGIYVNGKHENPEPYYNAKGSSNNQGNLSPRQRAQFGCVDLRQGSEGDIEDVQTNSNLITPGGTTPTITPEYEIPNANDPIDTSFKVKKSASDWNTQDDDIHNGVDPNQRNIKFKIISSGNKDFNQIKNHYDGTSNVWIVIHGWYKDPNSASYDSNYMEETAQVLKNKKPGDIVLALDWREASASTKTGILGGINGDDVHRAAKWIQPTARAAHSKLKSWGLTNGVKLNFVGHSLGTMMSTEIARQYGGSNTSVLLDPPSQLSSQCGYICWGYDIDGNTSGNQAPGVTIDGSSYYKNQFRFSRSFVGANSIAGNQHLAPTSHEAYKFNFEYQLCASGISSLCLGDEHQRVIDVFNRINTDTPITNNYLSYSDMNYTAGQTNYNFGQNSLQNGFEGEFTVTQKDQPKRTFTEKVITKIYDFPNYSTPEPIAHVYGTSLDNDMQPGFIQQREIRMYGGNGYDTFNVANTSSNYALKDFDMTDKIRLDPYLKGANKYRFNTVYIGLYCTSTITNTDNVSKIIVSGVGACRFGQSNPTGDVSLVVP
jgi:murein DD-endopeptidase MepM/ murein hydrolase activator NlpD/pimeloyl-ACP methyl ester carboxylesterase